MVRGERALRRHLEVAILVADSLNQPGLLRVAGHQRRTSVTALEQALPGVERKAALVLFRRRAVTLVAALDQHRADFFLEEIQMLASRFGGGKSPAEASGHSEHKRAEYPCEHWLAAHHGKLPRCDAPSSGIIHKVEFLALLWPLRLTTLRKVRPCSIQGRYSRQNHVTYAQPSL